MPRKARVVVPGLPHHVTQRGVRRQQVFFEEADYILYLAILTSVCAKVGVDIWAYCLMPNHVHFIAVPLRPDGLARAFGFAHQHYAVCINARYGWQGHLWQERFGSTVIKNDEYLMVCARYIDLNPVDGGLCREPEGWRWSSVHAHLNNEPDGVVTLAPLCDLVTDWRDFLAQKSDPRIVDALGLRTPPTKEPTKK